MKVLVVGGTSGIGLALVQHYLAQGHMVGLCGRTAARAGLPEAAHRYVLDVADAAAVTHAVTTFAAQGPQPGLDVVVLCAGFYFNDRRQPLDESQTLAMLRTHLLGLTLVFDAAAQVMLAQQPRRGQLVAIASVAGMFRAYPGASLYSATKRRVIELCDTYRQALQPLGLHVTALAPGYMDTARLRELNGGDARAKPFLLSEAQAVAQITAAIEARRPLHVFPRGMRWVVRAFKVLPTGWLRWRR